MLSMSHLVKPPVKIRTAATHVRMPAMTLVMRGSKATNKPIAKEAIEDKPRVQLIYLICVSRRLKSEPKILSVVDDLFPSEERTIIKADKAGVGIQPLKEERMTAVWDLGGGEYRLRQNLIKSLRESELSKHTQESSREVEYGDFADIALKLVGAQPLTLTDRNLIISYQKGLWKIFLRKVLRKPKSDTRALFIIPLKYAVFAEEKGRPRHLEIRFDVPTKGGDVVLFDLWLTGLSSGDRQSWLDKLNQVITEQKT